MKALIPIALAVGLAACGGSDDGGPTLPKPPAYPALSGNYTGTVVMAFPQTQQSVTCPATTSINQTNEVVYVMPIVLGAPCTGVDPILMPNLVIDTQGRVPSFPQSMAFQADCGVYTQTLDGGFYGDQFRFTAVLTSTTCPPYSFTAVLTKTS